ncbi:MAG: cytochrome c [Bacteroidota bacterium]|nr:cytochrome c [Bacteroidota bacterium]
MKVAIISFLLIAFCSCREEQKEFGCGTYDRNLQDTFRIRKSVGAALFKANCASCHNPDSRKSTGPGLRCATSRMPAGTWKYEWVKNSTKLIASGDAYATKIFNDYNKSIQTRFPDMTNEQIDSIFAWIDESYPCR